MAKTALKCFARLASIHFIYRKGEKRKKKKKKISVFGGNWTRVIWLRVQSGTDWAIGPAVWKRQKWPKSIYTESEIQPN